MRQQPIEQSEFLGDLRPMRLAPDGRRGRFAGGVLTTAMHAAILVGLLFSLRIAAPVILPAKPLMIGIEKPVKLPRPVLTLVPKLRAAQPISAPPPEFIIQSEPVSVAIAAPGTAHVAASKVKAEAAAPPGEEVIDSDYLQRIHQHLQKYLDDLRLGKQDTAQGVVSLHFIIDRSGRVLFFEIMKSSGHPTLDQDALTLIQEAAPLPPMPASMHGDHLNAVIPISFTPRNNGDDDPFVRR